MQRIVPTEAELAKLRAVLFATNLDMAQEGIVSLGLYEEMLQYVDESRQEKETTSAAAAN
jgi:hypothetical protein